MYFRMVRNLELMAWWDNRFKIGHAVPIYGAGRTAGLAKHVETRAGTGLSDTSQFYAMCVVSHPNECSTQAIVSPHPA